ncbi:MAG: M20/M25/M40 family metallo-hydrolase [Gemmatimonadota bacterium]
MSTTRTRDLTFDAAIAFAAELIRIPSPPGAEGEVAGRVRVEMERLGFDEVWTDAVGNVIGRVTGRGDGPVVMLSSHLDVVDAGHAADWEHPPFGGVIADGFLHGRGAMDIKGPLALQTYAAARFVEDRPPGDVYAAHTVLEERGGWGMAHLLAAGEVEPDAVVIGESTHGDVCIGHRGRAEMIIEIVGRAAHASAPERARNPLAMLPHVLEALDAFADELGEDPILGRESAAPTDVEASPRSRNVIPERARVILDWRVLPGRDAEEVVGRVRSALDARISLPPGYTLEVRFERERQTTYTGREGVRPLFTPGFLLDPDHAVARAAASAIADATGRTPEVRPWTFATDGGHSCGEYAIPTIGYAPGEERFAHTARERLELDRAREAYAAYPSLVAAVQRAAR